MTKYIDRDIASTVREALEEMPVVIITGMRQTGKSTFLRSESGIRERHYLSLDDFAQLASAREDPDGFIDTSGPITIDEAQKCPEILNAIKRSVDRDRRPGRFLLSGSANFALIKGLSETLAGRAVYFTMHPLTRRETRGNIRKKPFLTAFLEAQKLPAPVKALPIKTGDILTGGMPSICLKEVKKGFFWFKGYEQTYLERDVRELSQIGNIISFRRLLHLAALRTGQLLSPSQIGRDAKLNAATTSRYLSILEASFIINRLSPYLSNRATRLIKSPKMYMSDSGLAAYLAGVTGKVLPDTLKGPLFETYVAQNLAGIIDAAWPEASLYFWNVQGRHEVDFVIEAGGECLAIEVKAGTMWTERDLSGLRAFLTVTPHCKAAILAYNGRDAVRLGDRLWAMPLGLVLS